MKLYIAENWTVPTYEAFKAGELKGDLQDKCKEVEIIDMDGKQILHDRDRWRESEDRLAELFRPEA